MISNYSFKKNLKIEDKKYKLEIVVPHILNKFCYKICGSDGFYQMGKFTSIKNTNSDNILMITIKNIQIIFISIKTFNNKTEYFDFIDLSKYISKNIKIKIDRRIDCDTDNDNNLDIENICEENLDSDNESNTEKESNEGDESNVEKESGTDSDS